jgi:class 3 adenylate cyclase
MPFSNEVLFEQFVEAASTGDGDRWVVDEGASITIRIGRVRWACVPNAGVTDLLLPWDENLRGHYGNPDVDFDKPIMLDTGKHGGVIKVFDVRKPPHQLSIGLELLDLDCVSPVRFSEEIKHAILGPGKALDTLARLVPGLRLHTEWKASMLAVLFMDVVGYSKLADRQLRAFAERVLPDLAGILNSYRQKLIDLNTWGDAIVAVCEDPDLLAQLALEFRDYFHPKKFQTYGLPSKLTCRIALHAGRITTSYDPIRRKRGVVGTQMNLAARVEPITRPGCVFATDAFERMIDPDRDNGFCLDDLGEMPLAKAFGRRHLFGLRWRRETPLKPADVLETEQPPADEK